MMSSRWRNRFPEALAFCALWRCWPRQWRTWGMRYLPVEDKPDTPCPEVTRSSVALHRVPAPERSSKSDGSREMMWIWISPEQRHHTPPNTAESSAGGSETLICAINDNGVIKYKTSGVGIKSLRRKDFGVLYSSRENDLQVKRCPPFTNAFAMTIWYQYRRKRLIPGHPVCLQAALPALIS